MWRQLRVTLNMLGSRIDQGGKLGFRPLGVVRPHLSALARVTVEQPGNFDVVLLLCTPAVVGGADCK